MTDTIERLVRMLDAESRVNLDVAEIIECQSARRRRLNYVPRINCTYGLSMSVQASYYNYCTPRDSIGPYTAAEVGFPSERIEAFIEYAEDPGSPTNTVYGWVPVDVIASVIDAHGGFQDGNT